MVVVVQVVFAVVVVLFSVVVVVVVDCQWLWQCHRQCPWILCESCCRAFGIALGPSFVACLGHRVVLRKPGTSNTYNLQRAK